MTSRSRLVSAVAASMRSGRRIFADHGAYGIDVLVDQRQRNTLHVRRVLDEPAQAFGGTDDSGKTERAGFALDVMGGAEKHVVALLGEAVALDVLPRGFQPVALGLHPAGEFARQFRQRRFGARHRIVDDVAGRRQNLAQLVRRRDHFVIGVSGDRWGVVFTTGHR